MEGGPVEGESGRTSPVFNPATGEETGVVTLASSSEVQRVLESARRAFLAWRESSLTQRTRVLFAFREVVARRLDDLALVITDQHGKVLSDARGEVQRGLEVVEYACGMPTLLQGEYSDQVSGGVDAFSYRQPLGVVVGITPFNFPAMVPMWMFPLAIATGNAFVLKPSERDPGASLLLAEMWAEAGLPEGVFSVLQGDVEVVNSLLENPLVDAVSFVGSTPVAREIYRRARAANKRVQALGGAKNHSVVLPDADPDFVAEHLVASAFGSAGERCMAISTSVLVGGVADAVLERVADRARRVVVGSGRDAASEMGPVITAASKDRIESIVSASVDEGASLVVDGRRLTVPGYEGGFFVGPTVVDDVRPDMAVYQQEIFGPVLTNLRVSSVEDAIALVNANPYGNGTAIFTSSGEAARRFHREVNVGMIGINVPIPVPMAYYSFGGWKDSLFGDHHVYGPEGVRFYTRAKAVTQRWPERRDESGASFAFPTGR
jgi:malonate-semialdehyde dehydrogenase (acetylating)/methylmalonate-semialdehyde dehydrogenase